MLHWFDSRLLQSNLVLLEGWNDIEYFLILWRRFPKHLLNLCVSTLKVDATITINVSAITPPRTVSYKSIEKTSSFQAKNNLQMHNFGAPTHKNSNITLSWHETPTMSSANPDRSSVIDANMKKNISRIILGDSKLPIH